MSQRNPSNPFVLDEYFFANVTSMSYNQTTSYLIHTLNNVLAFVVGLALTSTLSVLIIRKTPVHLKPYARMLWICIFVELFVLISHFSFQIRSLFVNGVVLIHLSGPISYFSYQAISKVMCIERTTFLLGNPILAFECYFRYKIIRTKNTPTLFESLRYFFVFTSTVFPVTVLTFFAYTRRPEDLPSIDYGQWWYKEVPIPPLIVGSMDTYSFRGGIIAAFISSVVCYVSAIIFAYKTFVLTQQASDLSERSKSMQRQLNRVLIVQSIYPMVTSFFPVLFAVVSSVLRLSGQEYASQLATFALIWHPVLSIATHIVFIAPYRQALMEMVRCCPPPHNQADDILFVKTPNHVPSSVRRQTNP